METKDANNNGHKGKLRCTYCNRDALEELLVEPPLCDKHYAVAEMVHSVNDENLAVILANTRKIYQKYDRWWDVIGIDGIARYFNNLKWFRLVDAEELPVDVLDG